ncbi:hypothetical protein BuS5_02351 [Desulfosarcina sp. BuS5]|uniref:hypothetical protein n=1 Tax=Desulfosarcina sp. BuS5 TaxID=933262 RepID=UPI000489EC0A|nr:hypothetical protein [Desulfosarcina sp. BuS5]WDN89383.1 hypothetical protein BuS5_02351 [Desulfosarcina sp. BuS5]
MVSPEFQGGGLVRSAGGEKAGLLGRRKEEREKGDQRILGSGDFVGDVLKKAGEQLESMTKKLSPSTVSQNIEKGKNFLDRDEDLKVILQIN